MLSRWIGPAVLLGAASLRPLEMFSVSGALHMTPDSVLHWTLRRRVTIGGEADNRLSLSRLYPQDVGTDGQDRIYVLDRADNRVVVFDAHGQQVTAFGRTGDGPGELRYPSAIGVTTGGLVSVADGQRGVIVRFDAKGVALPEISTRTLGLVQRLVPTSRDSFVVSVTKRDSVLLVRLADGNPERLFSSATPAKHPVNWESCGLLGQTSAPLLSAAFLWTGFGQLAAYNSSGAFQVTFVDGAKSSKTVTRAVTPTRATPEIARRLLGDSIRMIIGQRPCALPIERVIEEGGISSTVPAYSSLTMDRLGRVWAVRTAALSQPVSADLFSVSQGYLGTLALNGAHPVAFLSSGAVVSLEKDDADVPVLVVYDVVVR